MSMARKVEAEHQNTEPFRMKGIFLNFLPKSEQVINRTTAINGEIQEMMRMSSVDFTNPSKKSQLLI